MRGGGAAGTAAGAVALPGRSGGGVPGGGPRAGRRGRSPRRRTRGGRRSGSTSRAHSPRGCGHTPSRRRRCGGWHVESRRFTETAVPAPPESFGPSEVAATVSENFTALLGLRGSDRRSAAGGGSPLRGRLPSRAPRAAGVTARGWLRARLPRRPPCRARPARRGRGGDLRSGGVRSGPAADRRGRGSCVPRHGADRGGPRGPRAGPLRASTAWPAATTAGTRSPGSTPPTEPGSAARSPACAPRSSRMTSPASPSWTTRAGWPSSRGDCPGERGGRWSWCSAAGPPPARPGSLESSRPPPASLT